MLNRRLLALLTVALTCLVCASPASAWKYSHSTQRPGSVVEMPEVSVTDQFINWAPVLTISTNRGPLVARSSATSHEQLVTVLHIVQTWSGSQWYDVKRFTSSAVIPRGYARARLNPFAVMPNPGVGSFRVVDIFAWADNETGRSIGATTVLPSRTTDHVCVTDRRPCRTGPGGVDAGRLYQLGGGWARSGKLNAGG